MLGIYVLPSEQGLPPRAVLHEVESEDELQPGTSIEGPLAVWSRDMGVWTVGGDPLPMALGDAITAHAKSLGVEW